MFGPILLLSGLLVFGVVSTTYKYIVGDNDEEPAKPAADTGQREERFRRRNVDAFDDVDKIIAKRRDRTIARKNARTTDRTTASIDAATTGRYGRVIKIRASEKMPERTNRLEDVYLIYYNGKTAAEYEAIPLKEATRLFQVKYYDKYKPTVIYVHGYLETITMESTQVLVNSYKAGTTCTNVLTLDWSNMAQGSYLLNAAPNARKVGEMAAKYLNLLLNSGLLLDRFHIIGHSLGSHVAAYVARYLKIKYQKVVKRLTALDPVFPAFYPGNPGMVHVSANDAEFVDVIHTDAGGFGVPEQTGTADFWPNAGERIQPGCPKCTESLITLENLCSHWRSWRYYAESVTNPTVFLATPAESYYKFKIKSKPLEGSLYMGYSCPDNATGNYYLWTLKKSPFGAGLRGIYDAY